MAAELGIGITVEFLVALATHCRDQCLAAKRYPEESTRIHIRLTYLLSSVPEWSTRLQTSSNGPGCKHLVKNLYDSLTTLNSCVEAFGESEEGSLRNRIRFFLKGKNLLDKLTDAESKLNQVLLDLNHDNASYISSQISQLHNDFELAKTISDKIALMITTCEKVDLESSNNLNDPQETIGDVINDILNTCHLDKKVEADVVRHPALADNVDFDDLLIQDRSQVQVVFDITQRIGVGGFAEVFQGQYNNENVAIKVIDIYRNFDRIKTMPEDVFKAEYERVRDEAILMKQCSVHSNIVDVYGYCTPVERGSKPWIVMELMSYSLNMILHDLKEMPLLIKTRFKLMRDIASAVEFLHIQGIVHQDIKASNILVDKIVQ